MDYGGHDLRRAAADAAFVTTVIIQPPAARAQSGTMPDRIAPMIHYLIQQCARDVNAGDVDDLRLSGGGNCAECEKCRILRL